MKTQESELNELYAILREISSMDKECIHLATELRNLFTLIEGDLKKPNPFGKVNPSNGNEIIADPLYGASFKEYNELRDGAVLVMEELEKNLKIILPQKKAS